MEFSNPVVAAAISATVAAIVSIGVALLNARFSRSGAATSYTIAAINNWNSPSIIDAREILFISMSKYKLWVDLRKNTKDHNACYVALSALDTIGYLIDKELFDQKRFGGMLERQATKLSISAVKTWPREIDGEFPHVRYLAEMGSAKN
jgi:hypothetical protein